MVYVLSDIHGHLDLFLKMLKKIKFSKNDTLYILGDVIDRGSSSVEILEYIMTQPNIHFILGNHEKMLLDSYYLNFSTYVYETRLWFSNGGIATFEKFKILPEQKQERIIKFLEKAPIKEEINVNGQDFILVHASYDKDWDEHTVLWERYPLYINPPANKIVIFGHTGTYHFSDTIPYQIYNYKNQYGIDCGLARNNSNSQLGCLCLNTMEEYYVRNKI